MNAFGSRLDEGQRVFANGTLTYNKRPNQAGKQITVSATVMPYNFYLANDISENIDSVDINQIHFTGRLAQEPDVTHNVTFLSVGCKYFSP